MSVALLGETMSRHLVPSLLTLTMACSAGFDDADPPGVDAGKADDLSGEADGLARLDVDPPPPLWEYYSIPITGRGPAEGTLLFKSTAGGQQQATLGEDGSFCVDVPLIPDAVTDVTFEAITAQGEYTAPVTVSVQQTGEPPEIEDTPVDSGGFSNVAYGAGNFHLHGSVESGALEAIVNGDTDDYVSIRNDGSLSFPEDFMTFSLREPGDVHQIVMHSDPSCVLRDYDIFLNQQSDAGPLYVSGGFVGAGWVRVAVISNGSAKRTINISGAPNVRQFGIHFLSNDCGPTFAGVPTGTGRHKISEIQVYAEVDETAEDVVGGDGSPSCLSGGGGIN